MMGQSRLPWVLAVMLLLAGVAPSAVAEDAPENPIILPAAPLHEQVLALPGDAQRPANLQVTVFTPEGQGPFPLAVMLHGVNGDPRRAPRYRFTYAAAYFLSRGYAVAQPMMRGFAGSGGSFAEFRCDYARMGLANARDVAAVIADLRGLTQLDLRHVVVAGQSFGGWNALALATMPPAGVRGVISFSGGVKTTNCQTDAQRPLADGARRFGLHTKLPSLWLYGDNDSVFSARVWAGMVGAYRAAGAPAEIHDIGSFMADSHQMLSKPESLPVWTPIADAFLRRIGLPGRQTQPGYLPMATPPPSGFADIDNYQAVPGLDDSGRAAYRAFLATPLPRAALLTMRGALVLESVGFDPLARGMALCRQHGDLCRPYAIDNDVVWQPPAPPVASHYAALEDWAKVPYLNAAGRAFYQHFLTLRRPRAFAVAPDGWAAVVGGLDPAATALAQCSQRRTGCALYAIDDTVVWRPAGTPRIGPGP